MPRTQQPARARQPGTRSNPFAAAVAAVASAAFLAAGCAQMDERQRSTAQGAGAGAVAGAILGKAAGNNAGRGAVIGGAVGAVAGNLWSRRMEEKRERLARASQGTGVEVARTEDNRLKLHVPSDVSFETGRADIRPAMRPVLDEVARNLDENVRVTVVGHTDSTGTDAINEPLSRQRAEAVRDYLAVRGVDARRIGVTGRGAREPVAPNASEAGRAANRRVEIFLSEPAA